MPATPHWRQPVRRHLVTRPTFGHVLAAFGVIFLAGSLAWAMVVDDFRPDRYDAIGAMIFLIGVAVIMFAPRS